MDYPYWLVIGKLLVMITLIDRLLVKITLIDQFVARITVIDWLLGFITLIHWWTVNTILIDRLSVKISWSVGVKHYPYCLVAGKDYSHLSIGGKDTYIPY